MEKYEANARQLELLMVNVCSDVKNQLTAINVCHVVSLNVTPLLSS